MIEFFQRYFDADGWMSADKLAPIVAEVIVGFSCAFPFFDSYPVFLPFQIQPVWDLILRADKAKSGKAAKHPFEGIRTMRTLDLSGCKLEGNKFIM
jgi:hypothetical protein